MNLPIETVVELLMANTYRFADIVCVHTIEVGQSMTIKADTLEELRSKVREYLLTLAPKQKLLSECEEYKGSPVNEPIMVYRVGKSAYRSEDDRWYGYADMCQVIQPVEVQ